MTRALLVALLGGGILAASAAAATSEHTVAAGETLWEIAGREDVYADPRRWRRIYEHNRDQITDPDRIYPGQRLRIPRRPGTGAAEMDAGGR